MGKPKPVTEQRPTVRDVVKLSGYSQGAVSRAFNGQGGISDSTRDKILRIAREIGYCPNPAARNFKRGYSARIGIILPNLGNSNYAEFYEQVDLVNTAGGYSTTLALTHGAAVTEANTMLHWSAGEADGLIVNPVGGAANLDLYRRLKSWRYPLTFLYHPFGYEFDAVYVNYHEPLKKALMHLRDVGHQKIAYVGLSNLRGNLFGKLEVLLKLLAELNMRFDEELSVFDVAGSAAGPRAFTQWGAQGRRPGAVIAYNDQTAISLYSDALKSGLTIPGDLSLFGSDDIAAASAIALSTIRVDRAAMARITTEILQNRIRDFDSPIQVHQMPSE
ncbi:MAG: LacI family DNA-binding transcriptional regulator, partial [Kiritimatiellia bacterium]